MLLEVLPYYIFLALTMLVYSQSPSVNSDRRISMPFVLTFIIMVLFAGLRNRSVGTDTMSYINAFHNVYDRLMSDDIWDLLLDEPGYYLLELFARQLSDNYSALLCVIASACYAPVLYSINKYSENKLLSLLVYIALGYYTFCFNAARQAIALSIYLLALPCLHNRNFVRYCILVLIAALFHKTVLIAIPVYFLFIMKYSWKSLTLISSVAIIISSLLPTLLGSAAEMEARYLLYATVKATGGYLLTTFYVLVSLFFIIIRKSVEETKRKEYDIYLQMLICGCVIYLVVSLTGSYVELTRFAAYFQIASIFLFAKIYNTRVHIINSSVLQIICVGCLIFMYIFLTTMAALVPYSFNPTL